MIEEWRIVPEYEVYAVSNFGRIKRLVGYGCRSERMLGVWNGFVNICYKDKRSATGIAPLILKAFGIHPPSIDSVARHLDDDRTNNCLANLAWGTQKQNVRDAVRNGKFRPTCGEKHHTTVLTESDVVNIRALYRPSGAIHDGLVSALAERYGVTTETIRNIAKRRTWKHVP